MRENIKKQEEDTSNDIIAQFNQATISSFNQKDKKKLKLVGGHFSI